MKIVCLTEDRTVGISPGLTGEHGLSLYIEAAGKKILFDTGQSGVFASNAERLGVNLSEIDFAVISHGHYDHGDGLRKFIDINKKAPVYISGHAFGPYYNGDGRYIGLDSTLADCERLVLTDGTLRICDGVELCAYGEGGEERDFESYGLCMLSGDSRVPDNFRHEQYMLITENGRRTLVSGCTHKGILNIMKRFSPDIFIGGFHLMHEVDGEKLAVIADALKSCGAKYYTCHCTGDAQYAYLKEKLSDRIDYLSTGAAASL